MSEEVPHLQATDTTDTLVATLNEFGAVCVTQSLLVATSRPAMADSDCQAGILRENNRRGHV